MAASVESIATRVGEIARENLCLAGIDPGVALHSCDAEFMPTLRKHYTLAETTAAEKLMRLKVELKNADTETFWTRLMEGMTDIAQAQYGFVAKRILVDDQETAVEMPAIGEHGSCLLGVAFYYNDGKDKKAMHRDYKYLAWGAPCAHMKHDKVFLVPERMSDFISHNPNALPFTAEGYLAVPLFSEGRCFAHFGMMWTQEGLDQKSLSWAIIEMMMHSLEDLIIERLVSGHSFTKIPAGNPQTLTPPEPNGKVVPRDAITATQSLKPYAKSLSHELRTPMHGVVGMLDIMHATVQEQMEAAISPRTRQIFQTLRDNIEIIQDSSKRAVEAADNVVHAYDMNMQIPDTPLQETDSPANAASQSNGNYFEHKPARSIEAKNTINPHKRRRSTENWHFGNATKVRHLQLNSPPPAVSPRSKSPQPRDASPRPLPPRFDASLRTPDSIFQAISSAQLSIGSESLTTPGLKTCVIRALIPIIIQESLRVGGRPDSAISEPTDLGERIEVRSRSSNGDVSQKTVEWSVEADVPDFILVDERDLSKLISAVVLNALKFTEAGEVKLSAKLSKNLRYLVIDCIDTGDGIPEDFQPELFKPFSREDDSTTRSKEGLGLGLLVAKGLARRIGGDLSLLRSDVGGPNKGSHFEIRVPLESTTSSGSRTSTPPSRTPEPSRSISRPTISATPGSTSSIRGLNSIRNPMCPVQVAADKEINASPVPDKTTSNPQQPPRKDPTIQPPPVRTDTYDRYLASKYPLSFLVAEDNKINRKLLVSMLGKLGYKDVHEAFDGKEAVRVMSELYHKKRRRSDDKHTRSQSRDASGSVVDVVLMDLWMPEMDGYQATEEIFRMFGKENAGSKNGCRDNSAVASGMTSKGTEKNGMRIPKILAVSADATDEALDRAMKTGMEGFMTKPYKLLDLQRLITEFCI